MFRIKVLFLAACFILGIYFLSGKAMGDSFTDWYQQGEAATDLDIQIMDYMNAIQSWTEKDRVEMKALAYGNRGLAYYHEGEFAFALQDYDDAIALDPKNVDFFSNRGLAFAAQKNYDAAIGDFSEVLALDPKNLYAFFSRGLAYQEENNYPLAIHDYTRAISLDPDDSNCYYYRGLAYANQNEDNLAISDFNKAIAVNPKNAAAYYQRALIYRKQNEQNLATLDLAAASKLDPSCCSREIFQVSGTPLPGGDMAFPCARCHLPTLGLFRNAIFVPADNPPSKAKYDLGKLLFFDKRLSENGKIACATCHEPSGTFTTGEVIATLLPDGTEVHRKIPTIINRAFSHAQFIDGRAPSLEEQVKGPLFNPREMKNPSADVLEKRIGAIQGYRALFKKAFGTDAVTVSRMGDAIATFDRTIVSGDSAYDHYFFGDKSALSDSAKRGMAIFFGPEGQCAKCHFGFNFTDELYHNIGIGMDKPNPDPGRYYVTHNEADLGAFKTPTLRDVARRNTFMHDGRFTTLKQVMDYYVSGGIQNPHLDPKMIKLTLTSQQEEDVIEFMKSLNGYGWESIKPPTSFPQ